MTLLRLREGAVLDHHVEHGGGVHVVEAGGDAALAQGKVALALRVRVGGPPGSDDLLHGDLAIEPGVLGPPYRAHGATADHLEEAVAAAEHRPGPDGVRSAWVTGHGWAPLRSWRLATARRDSARAVDGP